MEKGRVVIIDDSPIVRKLAQIALEEEGYTVYTAEDGEQGYKVAEEIRPSLILVDFIMPKVSGYQVCKMVRENQMIKDTPIILITGKGDEAGRKFTEKFGVADYFVKPFRSEALIEKVNSILQPGEGCSLDDVDSLGSMAGDTACDGDTLSSPFGVSLDTPAATGFDQPQECSGEPFAGFDTPAERESDYSWPPTDVPPAAGVDSIAELAAEVALGGGTESQDPGFFTLDESPETLSFDSPLDLDVPALLSEEGPNGDDAGGFDTALLSVPMEFPEGLPEVPEASLAQDGEEPLGITEFPFAIDAGRRAEDVIMTEDALMENSVVPETVPDQAEGTLASAGADAPADAGDFCESPPVEPEADPVNWSVSRTVSDCLDEKLPVLLEAYEGRIRTLLSETLEGDHVEAAVEKVLARHLSTTLPSVVQDKTAEALTLLKEPPGEKDIEMIVERVVSRHFGENVARIVQETSADIRKDLKDLPAKSDVAGAVEAAFSETGIRAALTSIEDTLTNLGNVLKGCARRDEISSTVDRALAERFPEDFAPSVKNGLDQIRNALDTVPDAADIRNYLDEGLGAQVPGIVESLLERHAAELAGRLSGLPGRTEIEGLLAGYAGRDSSSELLPQLTRSLEDMLKQHGLIRAPGIILSGDAAHVDIAQVLGMVAARGLTGRLSVYSVSLSSEMYLQRGTLCYASTSRQGRDPVLGTLLTAGAIATDALSPQAVELLQSRITTALQETLKVSEGKFYFEQGPIPGQLAGLSFNLDPGLCVSGTPAGGPGKASAGNRRGNGEGYYCGVAAETQDAAGE